MKYPNIIKKLITTLKMFHSTKCRKTIKIQLGLFSYQTWNGMDGFWQNGIALETMANAMYYGNHSRYFSVLKVHCIISTLFQSSMKYCLNNTINQVSTRQCKKYWAVAATIFYRIGYIKISNGRQYVIMSARRFHFTVLLKFRLEAQFASEKCVG